MTRRTRGREIALQVLYQSEQNPGFSAAEARRFIARRLRSDAKLIEFAETLIDGVQSHQETLDEMISGVAENWRIDRMAAIDRNILRLGAYELLHCPEVPSKVAINEALELAKRYSTAQSSRFVNGILDRLQVQAKEASEPTPADAEPAEPETPVDEEVAAEPTPADAEPAESETPVDEEVAAEPTPADAEPAESETPIDEEVAAESNEKETPSDPESEPS